MERVSVRRGNAASKDASTFSPVPRHRGSGQSLTATVPPVVSDVLRSSGAPLPASTRAQGEPRFGPDFSKIPIHAAASTSTKPKFTNTRADPVTQETRPKAERETELPFRIQKKSLAVSAPGDPDENEADHIAREVVAGRPAGSGGKAATIDTRSEGSAEASPELLSKLASSEGDGRPLRESTRREMESKMRADFSSVRIHVGTEPHELNRQLNAKAFTHGRDIYFADGNYEPNSQRGKQLLVHELVHARQQTAMASGRIQRQAGPKHNEREVVPNKGDSRLREEDQGAKGYMPDKAQFKAELSKKASPAEKARLVDDFVSEFFGYYKVLSALGIFQKSMNIKKIAEQVEASNEIRGIPVASYHTIKGGTFTNTNADWGKIKPPDPKTKSMGYASMMVLDQTENKDALDLLELKKQSDVKYRENLEIRIAKDTGDYAADLVTSLRKVADHVNKLYAVYIASQSTGMSFNDMMAFYGQEGYFTMPSSSGSLASKIPSPETEGASIASVAYDNPKGPKEPKEVYRYDFSTMNLVVPKSLKVVADLNLVSRQFWALLTYSLQITGSDVLSETLRTAAKDKNPVSVLAEWSLNNRKRSKDDPSMPVGELADTDSNLLAKLEQRWYAAITGIEEHAVSHRKAKTITNLDEAWVYAPKDPAKLTAFVLTESAFLLKAYVNKPRAFFPKADLTFDPALAYMMYNSTDKDKYIQQNIVTAVRGAQAASVSGTNKTGALSDDLKKELAALPPKPDFKSISSWVEKKPARWVLLMSFMEKGSPEQWKPLKPLSEQSQLNSSDVRTLSEFYGKVFKDK